MTKNLILFFSLIFILPVIHGQTTSDRPLRVEIPAKGDNESHKVIPCGQQGALMFFRSIEKMNDTLVKWYFTYYDKDLHQKWIRTTGIRDGLIFMDYKESSEGIFMVFVPGAKDKNASQVFYVLRFDPLTGNISGNGSTLPQKAEPVDFEAAGGNIFLGYNVKNEPAGLIVFNTATGSKILKSFSEGIDTWFTGITADTTWKRVFSYVKKSFAKNKFEFFLVEMDYSGNVRSERLISSPNGSPEGEEKIVLDVMVYPASESDVIAYGSYRSGNGKSGEKGISVNPATGIYIIRFNNERIINSVFTNFLSLPGAVTAGKASVAALKKKASKKNADINDYSLDFSVIMHPMIGFNENLVLLTELFTPQYHTENFTDFDFYGRPYTNSYRVFDGYRFGSGLITAFNANGDLMWDNSIDIMNLISFDLQPKVNLSLSEKEQLLCYLSQGKIGYKIVNKDQVVEKLDFAPLEMLSQEDKMLGESRSNMVKWYGNYYLCYGYQEIKNINASENRKRIVFYLTKVKFN